MKLLILLNLFFNATAMAQPESWHKGLESRLNYIINKSGLEKKDLGVYISYESFDKDVPLYDLNASKKMIPASLTKLFTAGAVLTQFEHSHKFYTQLKSNAALENGVLKGPLYLVGGGDPGVVSESFWRLVNEFTRTGIKEIEGDLIVDGSVFDKVKFDPSRESTRVDRAYDAPIGGMSFNWNSVNIFIRPGLRSGQPALVFADPDNEHIKIINETTTKKAGEKSRIQVSRLKSSKNGVEIIRVKGLVSLNQNEIVKYKSVTRPLVWSGENLKAFLLRRGITVKGGVKEGEAPENLKVLAKDESKPISDSVKDMMKFSNNFVAEMLTKNLSVNAKAVPGNMTTGIEEIKKFIEKAGVSPKDYSLINPSGLSRKNKFRAIDIGLVLNYLKNDFQSFPEYLVSLPIGGVDGTLKSRLKDPSVKAWVRAKTGRLNGVVSLAGYAKSKRKPLFTFVVIYNGSHKHLPKALELADRIALVLVTES